MRNRHNELYPPERTENLYNGKVHSISFEVQWKVKSLWTEFFWNPYPEKPKKMESELLICECSGCGHFDDYLSVNVQISLEHLNEFVQLWDEMFNYSGNEGQSVK